GQGARALERFCFAEVICVVLVFLIMKYAGLELTHAITMTLDNLRQMFLSPSLNNTTWSNALWQVTITLSLAFLSTILGAVISLFLAFGTAVNLSKPWVSNT